MANTDIVEVVGLQMVGPAASKVPALRLVYDQQNGPGLFEHVIADNYAEVVRTKIHGPNA